jgi:hypothetical protein
MGEVNSMDAATTTSGLSRLGRHCSMHTPARSRCCDDAVSRATASRPRRKRNVNALPGDQVVPDANVVFDRTLELAATPEEIWPWLVQLGKGRAGWYLPARVERIVPARRRGARSLNAEWQTLSVGGRIPDYGGRGAELEVASIDRPHALVYRSERHGAEFSWALILHPISPACTRVHLRFRGAIKSTGWRYHAVVRIGDVFDWATSEFMLRGLRERLAAQ